MNERGFVAVYIAFIVIVLIGLVGSGIYFNLQKDNTNFVQQYPSTSSSTNITQDIDSIVVSTVRTYALGNGYKDPIIKLEFVNETQAKGNIGDKDIAGGAKWFAAKIDNQWVVVHMGNGLPECGQILKYNLPKEFLSCY